MISDDAGNSETLVNMGNGEYQTTTLQGVRGRTYTLDVLQNANRYSSVCKIPDLDIAIDTIVFTPPPFGRDSGLLLVPVFQDPVGISNYYKFVETVNRKVKTKMLLIDDKDHDGGYNVRPLFGSSVHPGDTVVLEIQCIDQEVYTYFDGFLNFSNGFNASASPANPPSNIEGTNVLGFFNAHTSRSKTAIVQP